MFVEKLQKHLEQESNRRLPQHVNRVSSIGWPCDRFLVYSIVAWHDRDSITPKLQSLFNEGRKHELLIKQDLATIGMDIIWSERPVWFEAERLSGHIDGVIAYRKSHIAVEIKSISQFVFDKVNTADDMQYSTKPYMQCYLPQLQLYMYGFDLKRGVFLLKNKQTGEIKEIPITLDKEYARYYLNRCYPINDSVDKIRQILKETYQVKEIADLKKKGDQDDYLAIKEDAYKIIDTYLPDRICDFDICKDCSFRTLCLPDEIREERARLFINTELEAKLNRRQELMETRKEYNAIDTEVKERIKEVNTLTNESFIICGDFEITVKQGKTTRVGIKKIGEETNTKE